MTSRIPVAIIAATIFAFTAVAAESGVSAGDAKAGQQLFVRKGCFECHGYSGQGTDAGPKLAPDVKPLAYLQAIVRHPPNQMPPYSKTILSDEELADIRAYLSSIKTPRGSQEIKILQSVPMGPVAGGK